jgi:hypothetical protein
MPPRSYSYSSVNIASYDDQFSETDADNDTKLNYSSIPQTAKSVCFASHVEIFFVERIDDFTPDEIAAVWYDNNDFERMKQEIKIMVNFMEIGTQLPANKESTRGLEHRTRVGAWTKFHNKKKAYCAVLDEQDNQWKNGMNDCDAIAQVYMEHSASCIEEALQIGQQDAVAAQKVHHFRTINKYQNRRFNSKVKKFITVI